MTHARLMMMQESFYPSNSIFSTSRHCFNPNLNPNHLCLTCASHRCLLTQHVLGSVICLKVTPCKQAAVSDQETMSYDAFSKAYQQKNHMEAEGSGLSLTRAALPDLLRTPPPHHRPHHTLPWTVSLAQVNPLSLPISIVVVVVSPVAVVTVCTLSEANFF
ncbi:hypothetical protein Pcinc_001829 [Petrolisthes cinctipes]|uniref:Uncharacterized protein n=1 Tax=Petrolisthes cinctipes TaxID=88211 RepID=A0AAE1L3J1_PETCI|nr:hypothetical protein Pcinc_001829 [Petrolisthes cinctipes]